MEHWKTQSPSGMPLFVAANSGKGFVSFYDDVFRRRGIERRYIIKGGPGTGKSHLLRQVAAYAESRGRRVERYCCSSDPDSLDGIVIDGKIALLDGTAPHSEEPTLPGAQDELINLGVFWDAERLAANVGKIAARNEEKSACYRRAYRFLEACDQLYEVNRSLLLPYVKHEKMQRTVQRRLEEIGRGNGFSLLPGLSDAVSMRGSVHLDTYERIAEKLYVIEDLYDTGALFLRALLTGGMRHECAMRVSYHPIHVGEPNAVYFCDTGHCFVIGKDGMDMGKDALKINMKRFVDADGVRENRNKLRINARMYDALLGAAEDALAEAGEHHFALEEIYASCMDFEAQNRFIRSLCERVL